jgi:predicted ArsR family transcriptional regulator
LKGRPNHLLGRKIYIRGVLYPSLAEASRQTGIARKTIRKKLADLTNTEFIAVEDSGMVERPS